MLKIENLSKSYGDKRVLDNLTLHINAGEIFGFIGHNGAGKSTTIKCCVGILRFESGDIFIDGVSVKENPLECKRKLAYIPDNPDLYEYMKGVEYLNFIGSIFKVEPSLLSQRINKYAEDFELTSSLAQPISSYSHG
ncbi:MAG: ATP-binding cassette domain-containing protein, partial [Candidatus Coproplasma sp.]